MYEKIFHADNPFWDGMGKLFDIVALNLLWLLCSLPVLTLGASTTALYAALARLIQDSGTYLHRDFFRAFRKNFRRNALAGLLFMATGVFLWTDVSIARHSGTGIFTFLMVFFFILFAFYVFLLLYALPLLSLRDDSLKNILILSFTLSIRHFPLTLALTGITALALWVCHLAPVMIIAAIGISAHVKLSLLLPVLKPWIPGAEDAEETGESSEKER